MFRKSVDGQVHVVTRISHSSGEIGGNLAKLMANQCYLQLAEFWRLVDCPMSESEWDTVVKARSVDGRNPFIGHV
jgi:hypothetical protein